MTSAQSMPTRRAARARPIWFGLTILFLAACSRHPELEHPVALEAPYETTQLWAVAPFHNESGVSTVDPERIADLFVEQIEQVNGLNAVPVNRVIAAMRQMELRSIASANQAVALMNLLGVDGLVIGTVTAYDPYQPPKFGAAIQLYRREPRAQSALDPVAVTRARTETPALGAVSSNAPSAQASGVFDASNHEVLQWLDAYATGRTAPNSAFGTRIHLVDMELYTQFVAYRLTHDLLASERARLLPPATLPSTPR